MTRHHTLEVTEERSYEYTNLAVLRVVYERGIAQLLFSGQYLSFNELQKEFTNKDAQDKFQWLRA